MEIPNIQGDPLSIRTIHAILIIGTRRARSGIVEGIPVGVDAADHIFAAEVKVICALKEIQVFIYGLAVILPEINVLRVVRICRRLC